MEIASQPRTLRQVLKENFFFIPRFQREYSWTRENVEELWEDAIQEGGRDYFIGSMVVYPRGKKKDTVAVIDGQQRLTTLLILLCSLRDAAEQLNDTALANGTHTFIERKDEDDEERFVLTTETSYPFLQDEILSRGSAQLTGNVGKEEEAIQDAAAQISGFVESALEAVDLDSRIPEGKKASTKKKRLKEIRDKVLDLRLIRIEVDNQDGATTIFVTLNSRGKDLEPADLIKAHLLNLLPKTGSLDRPLERWQAMVDKFDQSQVGGLTMTRFLHASWRSRYGNATEANLAKKVRKEIKKANAGTYLKELEEDAELYRQIHEPTYRSWTKAQGEAKESLFFFGNFGIVQPMPLLLALMREFDRKNISIKQLRRGLKAIEDYHFAYNLLGSKTSSGGMSAFYAKRGRDLLNATTKNARSIEIDSLVDDLSGKRPADTEFDEGFSDLWLTDDVTADRRLVRYVLRRFYVHHVPKTAVDFGKMTVEHLSPQSAKGRSVGRLGNLIFVDEDANRVLEASSFAKKQAELKKLNQWVPQDILDTSSWSQAKIERRTAQLAEEARAQVWSG